MVWKAPRRRSKRNEKKAKKAQDASWIGRRHAAVQSKVLLTKKAPELLASWIGRRHAAL